ncbi:MAG: methionyl-tRNA formyltransferase [Proteobacteria bacterium]|nr:methionyl-tRNA formyltransferase [Pseudomonadota bacterium]
MNPSSIDKSSLRIGFAGTPDFAAVALQTLLENQHQVVAVYTQPDRPAGRGRALQMSPVKQLASRHQIPVFQPQSLRDEAALVELKALNLDLLVVVAYGLILPEEALNTPTMGCWNIHASLLPRWRGAAPIQRAIQAGDAETGVCIMQMDAGLDTGPVLHRLNTVITSSETGGSLHDRLATLGGQALLEVLQAHHCGQMPGAQEQAEQGVCYARKLSKAEAEIDWNQSADAIERSIRAFDPWPVAWAMLNNERIRIFAAGVLPETATEPSGSIVGVGEEGIRVACGQGQLAITSLQKPGGKKISAADYYNAQRWAKK